VIPFEARCIASPNIMFLNVDNEAVLLNTETELYFGLDDIGTIFWDDLTNAPSIQTALERLASKFDGVDEATLRNDFIEFIDKMQQRGLITVEG
jgi:hypothetical protein